MPANSSPFFAYGDGKIQTDFGFADQYGRGALLQPDGKIVVSGTNFLVRYNADGSLDTAFGEAGRTVVPFSSSSGTGQVAALQDDGKILFAGTRYNEGVFSYAVARYLADGSLDTGFGSGGIATVSFGSSGDACAAITVLADGSILLAGTTMAAGFYDYGLALLDADGIPVSGFGSDGKVITDFGIGGDQARAIAVQADGKILVAGRSDGDPGYASTDFSLARYNADGSPDTAFGSGGKLTASVAVWDEGNAVLVQPDGKIVLVGTASGDIVVLRFNADGTPDTGFDGDGRAMVSLLPFDSGTCVALQADGKILVGGTAGDAGSSRFALLRFNADGTLDDAFGTAGVVQTAFGSGFYVGDSAAYGVAVQADGKIVLSGTAFSDMTRDIGLVRYNRDGSLDLSFDSAKTDPLAVTAHVGEDRTPVVLDAAAKVLDAELAAVGDYQGATLTLARQGGANADDRFSASGALGPLTEGASLTLAGVAIGTVTTNSGGTLVLSLGAGATQARLDQAMQSIAYTNLGADPPGALDIAWTFDDGNAGAQGSGGARSVTGTSHVTVTLLDKAPQLLGVDADAGFTENGPPVALDGSVQGIDPELSAAGTYAGASITLARHGGADGNDRFSASGNLAALDPGPLVLGGVTIGTVNVNAGGILKLTFGANATQVRVDEALSSIAYAYAGDTPPASVLMDWTFNDGNTGAQGAGGAQSTQAQTLVHLAATNDAPAWSGVAAGSVYSYGSPPMPLDTSVHLVDPELAAGHYGGATVSLVRHGGADARDGFFARGDLGTLAEGGSLTLSGGTVGSVVRNSGGRLELLFDDQATQAIVDEVLSSIAYASTDILPPGSVQLDWTFSDGNTGDQGAGGPLSATASTVVDIVPANTPPEFDDVRADPLEVAEGGVAALDPGISLLDADLAVIGNYAGSTLTLRRHGGAVADDQFAATGGLGALLAGGPLYLGGITVGTVLANGGGSLVLGFNVAATQTVVDEVLRSIGYRFAGAVAPGMLQIDWTFDDGNTGAQGGDGAKSATAATSVHVIPVNGAPDLSGVTSTVVFNVDDKPVVVAPALHVYDPELSAADDFAGASITLQRQASANPEDRFGSTGNLAGLAEGGNLQLSGISVGTVTHNSNGLLTLTFNGGATQARVDEVLRSITYANTNNGPPGWVSLQWLFSDGNAGAQGSGGALTAQTVTGVEIPPLPNRVPSASLSVSAGALNMRNGIPLAITSLGQTISGTFGGSTITVNLSGGSATYSGSFFYVGRALASSSTFSGYSYSASGLGLSLALNSPMDALTYFSLAGNAANFLNHVMAGNDALGGAGGADWLVGLAGDDTISGGAGNDTLVGGSGADTMLGGEGNDLFVFSAAGDSTSASPDRITDFAAGDRVEFTGLKGMHWVPAAYGAQATVAETVAAIEADSSLNNAVVQFVFGTSDYLYLKGAGTGVGFGGTLVGFRGTTPLSVGQIAGGTSKAFANTPPTGSVTVTGMAMQGQVLTAGHALSDVEGMGAVAWQWQSSANGTTWTNIAGATAAAFTLGAAQVGLKLRAVAGYTDGIGTAESVASAPTIPVVPPISVTVTDNLPGVANGTANLVYTLKFNQPVGGLAADDFTVTNGSVGAVAGAGALWTVAVTPAANVASGAIGLTLKAGAVQGAAGNTNAEVVNNAQAIDTRPPSAPGLSAVFNSIVDLQTSLGEVVMELYPAKAPNAVGNMFAYVNGGHYDGTIFHRVIPNFVVQGGGFTPGLHAIPTFSPIPLESQNGLSNLRGTVAMARTSTPNSATSQFFINLKNNTGLDYASPASPGYAVFGAVVSGMSTVDAIAGVPTGTVGLFGDVPLEDVVLSHAMASRISSTGTLFLSGLETGATWQYSINSGTTWINGTGTSFTLPAGTYTTGMLRIRETDAHGNQVSSTPPIGTFVVDKTAPAVASFDPADNAIGAMPTGNILLTFSEKVRLGTGAILLKNGAGATVESFDVATSSRLSVSGATLSIDPTASLSINAKYSVVFAAGTVKDLAGNAYAGTSTYDFTTQGAPVEGTEGNDTLQGSSVPERLFGFGGDDLLFGKEGPDTLSGGAGDDTLDGGTGPDLLAGGTGNDTYRIDDPADAVDEGGNADTGDLAVSSIATDLALARYSGIEHLTFSGVLPLNGSGNAGANRLTGNDGANVLDGRGGADTLAGGKGGDTYVVDDAGDVVTEGSALATEVDLVKSGVSFVLGANLENLTLTGLAAIDATGNGLANLLLGNDGANLLDGQGGADTLKGGKGNDTYRVDLKTVGSGAAQAVALEDNVTENPNEGTDTLVLRGGPVLVNATTLLLAVNLENLDAGGTGSTKLNLSGNAVANRLVGNDADNILDGGAGNDTLEGGAGNDSYLVDAAGDVVTEEAAGGTDLVKVGIGAAGGTYVLTADVENAILSTAVAYNLTGNGLGNQLTGNAVANVLDGGAGADTLAGGAGNDSYLVDDAGDVVTEGAGGGTDTVKSSLGWTLAERLNLENLTLTGSDDIDATGNGVANVLTGNGGANLLDGGAGNDTLDGGAGADTLVGGTGNDLYVVDDEGDVVTEGSALATEVDLVKSGASFVLGANLEQLTLTGAGDIDGTGNGLANVLLGNDGANLLDGQGGADTLKGGKGNDTYRVDLKTVGSGAAQAVALEDNVTENPNEGTDTLVLRGGAALTNATTLILAANLEALDAGGTGSTKLNLSGNAVANRLVGNDADNILDGGAGNDTLEGGAGNDSYLVDAAGDVVTEEAAGGTDLVKVGIGAAGGTYVLTADVENAILSTAVAYNLTGNGLGNQLTGNAVANVLDGGAGADTLAGGAGNDSYLVDDAGDEVTEGAGGGTDTVLARIGWTLAERLNLENLTLTGSDDIDATGNGLANVLTGNGGANLLDGGAGNDTLDGGAGADTLVGGSGSDTLTGALGSDTYRAGIGDLVAEARGASSGDGIDVLDLRAATLGLSAALAAAFDSFGGDLKFSRVNAGKDLRIDFTVNGGASAGAITVAGMNVADTMVETLRLFDANGNPIGADIDLTSVWAASGTTAKGLALGVSTSSYGLLVQA